VGLIQARGAMFAVTYKVVQALPVSAWIAIVVEVPGDE
jgi:hypothetical protein